MVDKFVFYNGDELPNQEYKSRLLASIYIQITLQI